MHMPHSKKDMLNQEIRALDLVIELSLMKALSLAKLECVSCGFVCSSETRCT